MKKQLFFLAVAALALASCSSENDVVQSTAAQQTVDETAVSFDVYVNRGLTRAGSDGSINDLAALKLTSGFGVFGYYTDGERYSGITKPNFFYNQNVYWDETNGNGWYYTPVKYWPNEFGSDAISDQVDRVTLFAYAPWVDVTPLTGVVTGDQNTNIIGMSRNNVTGDPYVKYVATMDATNSTDLCYGVAAEDFTSSNSTLNQNNIKKGEPYIDVVKPSIDANSKIKFDFKHATAQLLVTVDADVKDLTNKSATDVQNDYTRIWIRSVTFEGITQKGALNLNGGEWYDINGTNKITTGSLTLYDGRKDGKEAILAATNETPSKINTKLIQSEAYSLNSSGEIETPSTTTAPGVTSTPENLFISAATADPVFVIPTDEKMKVTIVYDVETVDPNLAFYLSDGSTLGSTVENTISKTIDTFGNITAGYCYNLRLHLGMRTVDFDAEVTPWVNKDADVPLPSNVPLYAVASNPTIEVASNVTTYPFAITGLKASEGTTSTFNAPVLSTSSVGNANSSGVATGTICLTPNNSVSKTTDGKFTVNCTGGSATTVFSVTQLAAPLGLEASPLASGGDEITLTPTATGTDFTYASNLGVDNRIKVTKTTIGGTPTQLDYDDTPVAGKYKISGTTTGTLKLGTAAAAGDVYTITIKMKDAAPETVTVIVPAP